MDLNVYFADLVAMAATVTVVAEFVDRAIIDLDGWQAQLMSWAVAMAMAFGAQALGLGMFADLTYVGTATVGAASGLVANGIFSADLAKRLLEVIKVRRKSDAK